MALFQNITKFIRIDPPLIESCSFLTAWHKTGVTPPPPIGELSLQWLVDISVGNFLTGDSCEPVRSTVGGPGSGQLGLDCVRKQAEHARWSKSVSSTPPRPQLQVCLPSSWLDFIRGKTQEEGSARAGESRGGRGGKGLSSGTTLQLGVGY